MADQEHLDILKQGVEVWNRWREEHWGIRLDLSSAYLGEANLSSAILTAVDLNDAYLHQADLRNADLFDTHLYRANLNSANLKGARLSRASLYGTHLRSANLSQADLRNADLGSADLYDANLSSAHLEGARLHYADLRGANLSEADLSRATIGDTVIGKVDLSKVKGLDTIEHYSPSTIGIDTIVLSHGKIPEIFLRRAGVPDPIIEAIPSLIGSLSPIDFYSCFISYSSKDQDFAKRLYADLQAKGVRCWFAPENMKIGDRIRPRIDESIRLYDKLLLVLSEHSVASKWVEFEVEAAMDKEQERKPPVLFPVRLDKAVMESTTAWAAHIKRTRHIGDFRNWKNHDDYQQAFERLLRDLKASS